MAVLFRKMIVPLEEGDEALQDNDGRILLFIKEADFVATAAFLGYPKANQEYAWFPFDDVENGPQINQVQTYVEKAKKDEKVTSE